MLEWLRSKFLYNQQLAASLRRAEDALHAIRGENDTLKAWNEDLRTRLGRLEDILLKRYGPAESFGTMPKPIARKEVWGPTAASRLEEKWRKKETDAVKAGALSGEKQ